MENVPFYFQSSDEERDVIETPPVHSQPQQSHPPKKKRKLIQLSTALDPQIAELQSSEIVYLDKPEERATESKSSLVQEMMDMFSVSSSRSDDSESQRIPSSINKNLTKDEIKQQQQRQEHESAASDVHTYFALLNQDFFKKREALFAAVHGNLQLSFKRNKLCKSYTLHFKDQFVLMATKRMIENTYVISSCELGQDYYPFYVADLKTSFFKSSIVLLGKNLDSKNSKYYADDTLFSSIDIERSFFRQTKHTAVILKNSKAGLLGAKNFDNFGLSYCENYTSYLNPSKHPELGTKFNSNSVKNTILVNKKGVPVLVFARNTSTSFHLEIREPLSIISAFGTAVAICHSTSQ